MRGDIADLCYSRFFELAPDAKDLFRSDMERQRVKLMDMIAALVGSLDQRALLLVRHLGRQPALNRKMVSLKLQVAKPGLASPTESSEKRPGA
jgi:hypothetical protein